MSTWISVTPQMGLSYPGSIDSAPRTAVGTIVRFRNETLGEGEFIYLAGGSGVDADDVCSYQIDYSASVATSSVVPWAGVNNSPNPLCVATAATVASTWGWYQISGSAIVNSNGTVADGDDLFWQAAGIVSATPVPGKQMLNAVAASANGVPTTNKTIATIDRPLAQGSADVPPGEIYAVLYGVVADDPSVNVTTNTARLQNALDAAEGGVLILPPGEIRVGGPTAGTCLTIPAGGVRIVGAGRFVTVLRNATASYCFAGVDVDYVDICNIGFDGVSVAQLAWQGGIMFRGVVRGSIRDCWFHNIGQTVINTAELGFGGSDQIPNGTRQCEKIDITGNLLEDNFGTVAIVSKFVGALDVRICDNTIDASNAVGISVESEGGFALGEWADTVMVCRNMVLNASWLNVTSGNIAYGISITEQARRIICDDNIIDGVTADTLGAGINIGSSSTQSDTPVTLISCNGNIITNVTAASGRGHGIWIQTGDVDISVFTVNSNIIDSVEDGITFDTATGSKTLGTITDLSVIGNTITNVDEFGLWCANVSGSGELPVERATITGNTISGSGSHGVALSLINSVISANTISQSGGVGLLLLANTADCTIAGNVVTENSTNGIQAEGDRLSFLGNTSQNNGQGGAQSYGLYLTSGAAGVIVNNRCGDSQGSPTQDYGIRSPVGTMLSGNITLGNASAAYFAGTMFSSWVTTQNRFATVSVAADNAEHTVLTETVPQNAMAGAGMGLRVSVTYFGTWTLGSVIFRLKLASNTLSTITAGLSAFAREGTMIWDIGQTGSATSRNGLDYCETLNGTTTYRNDPNFDTAFDTTGGSQDVTVTVQIADASDTASIAKFAVEHLGW